jgi:hypothetical protein
MPMKYLGMLVSDSKLDMGAFAGIPEKIAKRIPHGKENMLPQGGD